MDHNKDRPKRKRKGTHKGPGYVKLMRTHETNELLRRPRDFALLTLIAVRARRTGAFSVDGLEVGQALVGDHKSCGLSRGEYRTSQNHLTKYGLAEFHGTRKGTIAKLLNASVFDINVESERAEDQPSKQPSDFRGKKAAEQPTEQPPNNHQPTSGQPVTKKEITKQRKSGVDTRARDEKRDDLAEPRAIAATASVARWSPEEFLEALKPYFPNNRIRHEYGRYLDHCKKPKNDRRPATPTYIDFIDHWMIYARPEAQPLAKRTAAPTPERPEVSDEERQAMVAKLRALKAEIAVGSSA